MESITGTAALYCSCASVLVPELIASVTSRIAVRSLERAATLLTRRLSAWWAAFSADLVLAKMRLQVLYGHFRPPRKGRVVCAARGRLSMPPGLPILS